MARFTRVAVSIAALVVCSFAHAETVLDFEGIAPDLGSVVADGSSTMQGFVVTTTGFYIDSGYGPGISRVSNGTDYLWARSQVELTRQDGGAFSIASFDASEYLVTYPGGQDITVTGLVQGGGSLQTVFTTAVRDSNVLPYFQTFTLGASWTNLTKVTFLQETTGAVYDNIRLDVAAVPLPASIWGGIVLIGLMGTKRFHRG